MHTGQLRTMQTLNSAFPEAPAALSSEQDLLDLLLGPAEPAESGSGASGTGERTARSLQCGSHGQGSSVCGCVCVCVCVCVWCFSSGQLPSHLLCWVWAASAAIGRQASSWTQKAVVLHLALAHDQDLALAMHGHELQVRDTNSTCHLLHKCRATRSAVTCAELTIACRRTSAVAVRPAASLWPASARWAVHGLASSLSGCPQLGSLHGEHCLCCQLTALHL